MKFIAHHLNLIGMLLLTSFAAAAAGLYFGLPEKALAARANSSHTQFTCPMHPQVVRNSAGDCRECGMKLVALRPGEVATEAKTTKGCCTSKPAAPAPVAAMSCPHLASLTNAAPTGCGPHK